MCLKASAHFSQGMGLGGELVDALMMWMVYKALLSALCSECPMDLNLEPPIGKRVISPLNHLGSMHCGILELI
jgi:hypothetical protein